VSQADFKGCYSPRVGIQSKTFCDAFYCNLLFHIEGIGLQGSFLHTLESVVSHGVMQYTKGVIFRVS